MNTDIVVSISICLILLLLPTAFFFYRYKMRSTRYTTLIKIAEIGGSIDPNLLKGLGDKQRTSVDDYRSSLIWGAIGLPLFIGGSLEEAKLSSAVLFLIPLFISGAYFLIGKYQLRRVDD